jgi:hypothetical protein
VPSPVVQLRVPEDILARIDDARGGDTRSAWVLRLIDRELAGQNPAPAPVGAASLGALPDGEPGNGSVCATPGCWQRDTRKFGLRQLPLCLPAAPPSRAAPASGSHPQARPGS